MTLIQTALSAILILVIALLALVVLVPAGLERLSRANRARREAYRQELVARRRDAHGIDQALHPWRGARSAVYREATSAVAARSEALGERLDATAAALAGLRCPTVFDYLFPIQHFLMIPGDATAILSDANRLRRIRAELTAAAGDVEAAYAALDDLDALPRQLASAQAALTRRLSGLEATIRQEGDAGIVALDDLARGAAVAQGYLEEYRERTTRGADREARPEALDAAAVAQEKAAVALSEAEARAAELAGQRAALDESISRATTDLDALQAAKAGPGADDDGRRQIVPLTRRAAALLNESAPDHRRRREFNAAAADVAAAAHLTAAARDLFHTQRHVRTLVARDDGAALHPTIAALRGELADTLERAEAAAQSGEGADGLARRAARSRAAAEEALRRQDEAIARLESEAMATRERLERSWAAAQERLALADDDALARRRCRLLDDFQAAQRRPAELEKFRRDVAAFEETLGAWTERVGATQARVARLRERLPGQIDAALAAAEPWRCLKEDVTFIQQRAADFETARSRFAAVAQRHRAEPLMEEIEAIEADVNERAAVLGDRAERLRALEGDVKQIVELSQGDAAAYPADHPDRARWDKATRMIDHHLRSAHVAIRYDDASVALLRAADVANRVAL